MSMPLDQALIYWNNAKDRDILAFIANGTGKSLSAHGKSKLEAAGVVAAHRGLTTGGGRTAEPAANGVPPASSLANGAQTGGPGAGGQANPRLVVTGALLNDARAFAKANGLPLPDAATLAAIDQTLPGCLAPGGIIDPALKLSAFKLGLGVFSALPAAPAIRASTHSLGGTPIQPKPIAMKPITDLSAAFYWPDPDLQALTAYVTVRARTPLDPTETRKYFAAVHLLEKSGALAPLAAAPSAGPAAKRMASVDS